MIARRRIAIRGAGLSGLSLACELKSRDPAIDLSVFDRRSRYPHPQRTFSFFKPQGFSAPFDVPCYSWPKVIFRGRDFNRLIDVSASPYMMIKGDDLFTAMLKYLENQGVNFKWDCQSVKILDKSISVNDTLIPFDIVVDAAFDPREAHPILWQSFAGLWIETKDPSFEPNAAVLIDLQDSQSDSPVSFFYLLPTSTNHALIEHTTFSQRPLSEAYHLKWCFDWLQRSISGEFVELSRERGAISMGLRVETSSSSTTVGSNSGVVRSATGYGFLNICEQVRDLSNAVINGTEYQSKTRCDWLGFGDRLFLSALRRAPLSGDELLGGILKRAADEDLIAFLSDRASPKQAFSVWMSVAKWKMLRGLLWA